MPSEPTASAAAPAAEPTLQANFIFRAWGTDRPGLVHSCVQLVAEHDCAVCNIGQFMLEGCVTMTLSLHLGEECDAEKLKDDLTKWAEQDGMTPECHVPATSEDAGELGDNVAIVSLVSHCAFSVALLRDVDAVLKEHGCIVENIMHRSDDKRENNGDYNKMALRILCPSGFTIATLLMGKGDSGDAMSSSSLQQTVWRHNTEVTVRWWDAMNRPNTKALVVFGLSNVLCPCDVLDEVLKECGFDPNSVDLTKGAMAANKAKVAMLKGHDASAIDKVAERIEFTPGARLLCNTLKHMGFRLAVLTNTGMAALGFRVRKHLGIDHTICRELGVGEDGCFTGAYAGDLTDVSFRKADILRLMAEREGIDCRNVIPVGELLSELRPAEGRRIMDSFGPAIFFNSKKLRDLTIVLYLLGLHGADISSLKRKRKFGSESEETSSGPLGNGSEEASPVSAKRVLVQVSSTARTPGQLHSVVADIPAETQIATLRQTSLQGGGMCVGLDIRADSEAVAAGALKAIQDSCNAQGFHLTDISAVRDETGGALPTAAGSWRKYYQSRHVVTMVQQPDISAKNLSTLLGVFAENGVNIVDVSRLSTHDRSAMQFLVSPIGDLTAQEFAAKLSAASREMGVDLAFQKDDLDRCMRRMVVFDMDSTLIQQEVIDELAKMAGVEDKVKELTERAMRGELNFAESLKARVGLLKGHNAEELFSKVKENLIFTPGAKKLCTILKSLGYRMAVISGGFIPVAQEVKRQLGLDYAFANSLEVDEATGLLTGHTSGPIVTPERKRALLATIASVEECSMKQTIAVGDGANDIPMLHAAGLGIAFCAKPKVQAATDFRINQKDLSTVLFLIGINEHAADRLASSAASD